VIVVFSLTGHAQQERELRRDKNGMMRDELRDGGCASWELHGLTITHISESKPLLQAQGRLFDRLRAGCGHPYEPHS
jgi:hypothetical protein